MTARPHIPPHIPVMAGQVIDALAPRDGGVYVDGTFGAGGYARAILDAADCRLIAFDRDPDAVAAGAAVVADYGPRLTLIQ
ncbi:MAG: 16S rRNA (cytosine(1402)-N(4))-methyltransferase, partial [Rhodospirillaceae bacterium]|nr:16S rRNA (cytosine(1402)-N(4))-methyltransferase [Rhodospirillaceae bacterium]